MAIPSVGKDVEDVEVLSDTTALENSLDISWKVNHTHLMIQPFYT